MYAELLNLFKEYSNKKLDKNYYFRIIQIVSKYRKLDNYIRGIEYNSLEYVTSDALGGYDPLSRIITLDMRKNKDEILDEQLEAEGLNENEMGLLKKLLVMQCVLHELEHVRQQKIIFEGMPEACELERIILGESFYLMLSMGQKKYLEFYELDPCERLANIKSFGALIKILELEKEKYKNIHSFVYESLYPRILKKGYKYTYEAGVCPLEFYLRVREKGNTWEGFSFYSNDKEELIRNVLEKYPSMPKRLSLGLPINKDEEDYVLR